MANRHEAEAVLAVWREVERSLASVVPGSPEFERLASDAAHLRDEYQRLVREAMAGDQDGLTSPEPKGATST